MFWKLQTFLSFISLAAYLRQKKKVLYSQKVSILLALLQQNISSGYLVFCRHPTNDKCEFTVPVKGTHQVIIGSQHKLQLNYGFNI